MQQKSVIDFLDEIDKIHHVDGGVANYFLSINNWAIRAEFLDKLIELDEIQHSSTLEIFKKLKKETNKFVRARMILTISIFNSEFFISNFEEIYDMSISKIEKLYFFGSAFIAKMDDTYIFEVINIFMRSGFVMKSNAISIIKTISERIDYKSPLIDSFSDYALKKFPELRSIW